jgi:signal transduction histidine kinase
MRRYDEVLASLKDNSSKEVASFYEEMDELKKKLKIDFIMKDFQKVIADSLNGTQRIKKIVADLKNFSRVDQEEFKTANINEGIESTLNVVWNELKYKCTVEKEYGDLPQIYCNLGQLNQVFVNLLINAAQAIEEKGVITISTRYLNGQSADNNKEQDYIEIKISDTGRGIPDDKLNRIFDPFFTTKDVGKGTGLGLSIAYDIIQKHKGKIEVGSEVGKGTTFTIKLPLIKNREDNNA